VIIFSISSKKIEMRLLLVLLLMIPVTSGSCQVAENLNHYTSIPKGAQYSILVRDADSGDILASHNTDMLMIPASVLKLVTTATVLEKYGSDFRFNTRFFTDGEIRDGVIYGNIIIKGGGDGTLGSSFFDSTGPEMILNRIRKELERNGIIALKGSVVLDESAIPEPRYPAGRLWDDMANYYGAPPSALSWRDNSFELVLRSPAVVGSLCEIRDVRPKLPGIEFRSFVSGAVHNRDSAYIFGYPGLNQWEVRGSIPAGRSTFTIKGALPDPGLQFALEFKQLFSNGSEIEIVSGAEALKNIRPFRELFTISSPPLSDIIAVVNQRSHNLLADHLFLTLYEKGLPGMSNWDEAGLYLTNFWKAHGIASSIRLKDGSGLSPKNLITAEYMVDLISFMYKSPNSTFFEESLAVGGQRGTLSRMWASPAWQGRVVAKSGYMEGVLTYAGYIKTHKNRRLAFCIMVNNFTEPVGEIRKLIELEIGGFIEMY
jgi:serine-type D-Ala-D-Ala carboxypeptidase/endopeptidase (penicillin-binding protein 4)